MAYLEELLPEFRNGVKIRNINWEKEKFLSLEEDGSILDQSRNKSFFYGADLLYDDWELYEEPIDWDYIIKNKCLCKFWDNGDRDYFIGDLISKDNENDIYCCGTCNTEFENCQPIRRDEVTFYENRVNED